MTHDGRRPTSIAVILLLTMIAVFLIAIPRLTAGARLHPTMILWFVTLHQIALATTLATIVWVLFGRRLSVAVLFAVLILGLWGPNLAAMWEYNATGKSTKTFAVANAIGVTAALDKFYAITFDVLGYDFLTSQ